MPPAWAEDFLMLHGTINVPRGTLVKQVHLTRLNIQNFRSLLRLEVECSPGLNFFFGKNGVGKTSVLEAIYLLSTGYSFRTRQSRHVILESEDSTTVFAQVVSEDARNNALGVCKHRSAPTQVQLNGEGAPIEALARLLPSLILNAQSFDLLCGEPKLRRQRIDWGLFHVEQSFAQHWRIYHQALKQRNRLLHDRQYKEISHWNQVVARSGEILSTYHQQYIEIFCTKLSTLMSQWFGMDGLNLNYVPGWDQEHTLLEVLELNLASDSRRGFTQLGPHRSDLKIRIGKMLAKDRLSRGQLKRFAAMFTLAQAELLIEQTGVRPVLLVDDFTSELDENNQEKILGAIKTLGCQCFVTAIEPGLLARWRTVSQTKEELVFHMDELLAKNAPQVSGLE